MAFFNDFCIYLMTTAKKKCKIRCGHLFNDHYNYTSGSIMVIVEDYLYRV